ncbi:hypothetical protein C8J56DRAFT_1059791 [Mycena floridula]|nr:hypothetical protein C8J56DRAFT_1059791 [Mycena floridula]
MLNVSAMTEPRFPLELFRPMALLCDCPLAISSLSRCNRALNREAAPALYREIHLTNASRRRGTMDQYDNFIVKAAPWCRKFILNGGLIDDWVVHLIHGLGKLVELHIVNCLINDSTPMASFGRVDILQVIEQMWNHRSMTWAIQSCRNAVEATLIYAGATMLPGNHCRWTADSPESDPGTPKRPNGPGLGLLRVKTHVDFQELFFGGIVESGISLTGITQLELDIWGPPSTAIGSQIPSIILAPRLFKDLPNVSHVYLVGNYPFVLSGLVNLRTLVVSVSPRQIAELVTTMRDLPLLPRLEQYLIKVLVDEGTTMGMIEEIWIPLDEHIFNDRRRHPIPCGRGVVFWRCFFHNKAICGSSREARIVGYPL